MFQENVPSPIVILAGGRVRSARRPVSKSVFRPISSLPFRGKASSTSPWIGHRGAKRPRGDIKLPVDHCPIPRQRVYVRTSAHFLGPQDQAILE